MSLRLMRVVVGIGLSLCGARVAEGGLVAYWDFNDSNLAVDQGNGTLTTDFEPANVSYLTGSTQNALSGVAAGNALALTAGAGQINNGRSVTANVSASTAATLVLSLWTQRTSTGFATVTVEYDIGAGFVSLGSYAPVLSPGSVFSFNLPPEVNGQPSIDIRFTFTGATGSSGNNRIDNLLIESTGEVGACCELGNCSLTTFDDCQALNGVYQGDGTGCEPSPCPATGSCCGADYSCADDVTQEVCVFILPEGVWVEGGSCLVDCAPPTGSCCLSDGSCLTGVTESDCADQGGHQWTQGAADCVPACQPATQAPVIISEYYESAPGNRKALEIFNTTPGPVSLDGHTLALYSNLNTSPNGLFSLNGLTIGGLQTLVFINNPDDDIPNFDEATAVVAPNVCQFNGDDAIAILFGDPVSATVVDILGIPGQQDSGPRGADPYKDAAWERGAGVTLGVNAFDPCNFDGMKNCAAPECPPGTPVGAACTDGASANQWVFEGLNPDTGNGNHTLGAHSTAGGVGACCLGLSCSITSAGACASLGGVYQGDGTLCSPLPCGPRGSCCQTNFTCTDDVTAEQCSAISASAVWTSGGTCAADCVAPVCDGPYPTGLVINEFDSEQVSVDTVEFLEIYNGTAATIDFDATPMVLVLYNGNGDVSYRTIQLIGSVAPNDYFVVGSDIVPNVDQVVGTSNIFQNGPDAAAIYTGCSADWPNGTPATTTPAVGNFGDALVYGTDDPDDPELLAVFGGPQFNDLIDFSISLIPNGNMSHTFVSDRSPTPGASNGGGPATGACCMADQSCANLEQAACASQGGQYQGDGTNCGSVTCPDPCDSVAPLNLLEARSVVVHATGEFYISLDITDNPAARTSEPRSSGVAVLDLVFDAPIVGGSVAVNGGPPTELVPGAGTGGPNGARATLSAPLSNDAVYSVSITAASVAGCDNTDEICVAVLVGDFNSDGVVNAADKGELLGFVFQTVGQSNAAYDVQVGLGTTINVTDVGFWTGFFGTSVVGDPCP